LIDKDFQKAVVNIVIIIECIKDLTVLLNVYNSLYK